MSTIEDIPTMDRATFVEAVQSVTDSQDLINTALTQKYYAVADFVIDTDSPRNPFDHPVGCVVGQYGLDQGISEENVRQDRPEEFTELGLDICSAVSNKMKTDDQHVDILRIVG